MVKEEMLLKIKEIEAELEKMCEARKFNSYKFKAKIKEWQHNVIEINKLNNCYWDRKDWIFDAMNEISPRQDLTGNALTNYYANELNKLNGVMLERKQVDAETINYLISVITPYSNYSYMLKRGYNGKCTLEKSNFLLTNINKAKSRAVLCVNHICELVYESDLDTLRTEFKRDILDK